MPNASRRPKKTVESNAMKREPPQPQRNCAVAWRRSVPSTEVLCAKCRLKCKTQQHMLGIDIVTRTDGGPSSENCGFERSCCGSGSRQTIALECRYRGAGCGPTVSCPYRRGPTTGRDPARCFEGEHSHRTVSDPDHPPCLVLKKRYQNFLVFGFTLRYRVVSLVTYSPYFSQCVVTGEPYKQLHHA